MIVVLYAVGFMNRKYSQIIIKKKKVETKIDLINTGKNFFFLFLLEVQRITVEMG